MASKRDKVRTLSEHTFTVRADELALFRSLLPRERTRAVDILVLHGIGGMGKSRLLDQYQQIAASEHIPTARIDPQIQATVYSFLTTIHQQLAPHLSLPRFEKGMKHHDEHLLRECSPHRHRPRLPRYRQLCCHSRAAR